MGSKNAGILHKEVCKWGSTVQDIDIEWSEG